MSKGYDGLHSHSGLEREINLPKNTVLIDKRYGYMFLAENRTLITHKKIDYYKVNILSFVKKGGVFRNLYS